MNFPGGRLQNYLPVKGFFFDRPVVIVQSDDWGLAGIRDAAGFAQLQAAGIEPGKHPYEYYALETAEDLRALYAVLKGHRDARGRHPSFVFNFVVANVDFGKTSAANFGKIELCPLAEGLPAPWERPGLLDAYHEGIAEGLVYPAFHGLTHFCLTSAERALASDNERNRLLRVCYAAGTSMIPPRMAWLRCEYYDRMGDAEGQWLPARAQQAVIQRGVEDFRRLFGRVPLSACAPGYRANADTRAAWRGQGIRVAQGRAERPVAPYYDPDGLLRLYRNVDLEPATDEASDLVARAIAQAERAFAANVPAIVSMHSINFHSTIRNFRGATLERLDEFLSELETRHADLMYLHDGDLWDRVRGGTDLKPGIRAAWRLPVEGA